jgi:hypothetical protein
LDSIPAFRLPSTNTYRPAAVRIYNPNDKLSRCAGNVYSRRSACSTRMSSAADRACLIDSVVNYTAPGDSTEPVVCYIDNKIVGSGSLVSNSKSPNGYAVDPGRIGLNECHRRSIEVHASDGNCLSVVVSHCENSVTVCGGVSDGNSIRYVPLVLSMPGGRDIDKGYSSWTSGGRGSSSSCGGSCWCWRSG